ncbi:MAG: TonB-dependent receptor, partial [Candidatus Acidiferrales bacterium]
MTAMLKGPRTRACGLAVLFSLCASLLLIHAPSLSAQEYLATLSGTVTDPAGALVSGANVKVTSTDTNVVTPGTTNQDGTYSIPFLVPGNYKIEVDDQGFKPAVKTGIVLQASGKARVDFQLVVGAASQTVTVQATGQLLTPGTAAIGQTLDAAQVADLPNIGRNPFIDGDLSAGTYSNAYMDRAASQFTQPFSGVASQMVINGISDLHRLELDGIPDDAPERNSAVIYTDFVPSPEAVEEVTTQTALYDAQYGHTDGAVINTVIKTGTNTFHGAAYYIFQNTDFDANSFQNNDHTVTSGGVTSRAVIARGVNHWNQPGFVIDGPVWIPKLYNGHDKTFFTVAYERVSNNQIDPATNTIPTQAEIAGNFQGVDDIYDPTSSANGLNRTQICDGQTVCTTTNENIIPTSMINPVAQKILQMYFPSTTTGGTNNFTSPTLSTNDQYYSFLARVDQILNDKEKFNVLFFRSYRDQQLPNPFPGLIAPTGGSPGFGYYDTRNDLGAQLDWVSVISPTLVLDTRASFLKHPFSLQYPGVTYPLSSLGFSGPMVGSSAPASSFPGLSFDSNYVGLENGGGGQQSDAVESSEAAILSKSLATQTLKIGFEFDSLNYGVISSESNLGTFSFNEGFTEQNYTGAAGSTPNPSDGLIEGNPIASFLLGYPSSASAASNAAFPSYQQLYYGVFLQDDWRVTHKLTLNLGLRWDYEQPLTARGNSINDGFCLDCSNPIGASFVSTTQFPNGLPVEGGLTFASATNRYPFKKDFGDWQPRFGLALQVTPKMVLRGGVGIMYIPTIDDNALLSGFSSSTSFNASTNGGETPAGAPNGAGSFTNPYPNGFIAPTGSSAGLETFLGQNVTFEDPLRTVPYGYAGSLSLQYQIAPNTVFEIGYVANAARRLQVSKDINALPAQFYNPTSATYNATSAANTAKLTASVTNPMAGLVPGGSINGATIPYWELLLPYPEFGTVQENDVPVGQSSYNSLQTTVIQRLSHGLSVNANFTFAKIMDKNWYINPYNTFDQLTRYQDQQPNHIFNLVVTYAVPVPGSFNGWERAALGGWQVNGVMRWQNGLLIPNPGSSTGVVTPGQNSDNGLGWNPLANPAVANPTLSSYW